MKKLILFALLTNFATNKAFGQTAPKPKKIPLYRVVMTCPKGQTLYIKQQAGMKSIGNGMIQIYYEWHTWNGMDALMADEAVSARCFKGNPPILEKQ